MKRQAEKPKQLLDRDHFIPVRESELVASLSRETEDAEAFRRLSRLIGTILHLRYFDQRLRLRDDYHYFNPDVPHHDAVDPAVLEAAHDDLVSTLSGLFHDADFIEVSLGDVYDAHHKHHFLRVAIDIPMDCFREVKIFRRGHHLAKVSHRDWFGLRHREAEVEVYDHIALLVMIKPQAELNAHQRSRLKHMRLRPGTILIKYFRDIARADMAKLFPGVRVVMSLFDKLVLGLPAIAGGIPLLLNLLPTISVLFLVIGFYLGFSKDIGTDHLKQAMAGLSALVALGGFTMQQWVKYQRRALKYQKDISDNVYFRNINNNAGLFDAIIGAAESEEWKKSVLAYVFLLKQPGTQEDLDSRIETWLRERYKADIEFDVADALERMVELDLLERNGAVLSVPKLSESLARLDTVWKRVFQSHVAQEGLGSAAATRV